MGRQGEQIVKFECKRRWYWWWGREWRYRDDGELLPFAMTSFGFFTIVKDTREDWRHGWFFWWNRD